MNDPLAQFRKKPTASRAVTTAGEEQEEYLAFGTKDRTSRLKIRRASAPTRAPGYAYLLDIAYDGGFGTNFVLAFTFFTVLVRGKNLQLVITALETNTADFIQEFDPDRWPKPKDATAPYIESIELVMNDGGSMDEAEKMSDTTKPH